MSPNRAEAKAPAGKEANGFTVRRGSCGFLRLYCADKAVFDKAWLLRCMSPLLAQSGHAELHCTCPLLGVKRT